MVSFNEYQEQSMSQSRFNQKKSSVLEPKDDLEIFQELFDRLIKEQKLDPADLLLKLKKYDKSTFSQAQPTHQVSASDKKYTHDALLDE